MVETRRCFTVKSVAAEHSNKAYRASVAGFNVLISVNGTCQAEVDEVQNIISMFNKDCEVY
jgi:hypothetical protein